jgi:hypothetical protein
MRKIGNYSLLGQQPCGGTARGNVHFMATPGSRNFIAWKIVHPSPKGNCTIRLGQGPDEGDFKVIFPLDKSANKKGSFPCGREESGLEGKEVMFPANFTCDACTLQWEWTTELGQMHICSDILIIDKEIEECAGKC